MRIRSLALVVAVCLATFSSSALAATVGGGADHTVVVKPDGTVWTWGDNTFAQLGDGTLVSDAVPTPIV